jgi:Co/Zn/Cd efflux system component
LLLVKKRYNFHAMHYHRPTGQKATTRAILQQELWLLALTLLAAMAETGLGFWIAYQSNSVALLGYSVESLLEAAAASIVGWRILQQLRGVCDEALQKTELFAERLVAGSFLGLGLYVAYESLTALATGAHAEPTAGGIWLAVG